MKSLDMYEQLKRMHSRTGNPFYEVILNELELHRSLPEENIKLRFKIQKLKAEFINIIDQHERECECDFDPYRYYPCIECEYNERDEYDDCLQCPVCCGCSEELSNG